MTGVKEYICLHFGSNEARTTMAELEEWREKDPQPCYIKILRRLFPDIKTKVLQLLLAACDGDLIKTVETILPCCKKTNSNGQVTYIKATASTPPQKVMLLSRSHKIPARLHDKREMLRYAPYPVQDRTHGRCSTFPGLYMPPYAHAPVVPGDNCGLCVPGFTPSYYLPTPRIARDLRNNFPYYTTPKCNFSECKTVTSNAAVGKDDTRTSAAATLISLSNS